MVLCDRFYDSTTVYQGYGRGLDLGFIRAVIDFAVGRTRPDLTLLFRVPLEVAYERRNQRSASAPSERERFEEADRAFFQRVEEGYESLLGGEPDRIRSIDATLPITEVSEEIWKWTEPFLTETDERGVKTYKSLGEWDIRKLRNVGPA